MARAFPRESHSTPRHERLHLDLLLLTALLHPPLPRPPPLHRHRALSSHPLGKGLGIGETPTPLPPRPLSDTEKGCALLASVMSAALPWSRVTSGLPLEIRALVSQDPRAYASAVIAR